MSEFDERISKAYDLIERYGRSESDIHYETGLDADDCFRDLMVYVKGLVARIAELEKDLSNKEIEYTDLWDDALALQARIAELEGELAELKERFDITDGLLNQATVSIGAVIACCTYNSNAEAMAGAYGISYRAFTMIDNFIKNYNRAVLDGKASTDVKNIICWPPNPPEVQE